MYNILSIAMPWFGWSKVCMQKCWKIHSRDGWSKICMQKCWKIHSRDESIFLPSFRCRGNVLLKCKGNKILECSYFLPFWGFLQMGSCKGNSLHSHANSPLGTFWLGFYPRNKKSSENIFWNILWVKYKRIWLIFHAKIFNILILISTWNIMDQI